MNICEKINLIKQSDALFNFNLRSMHSDSWGIITRSLTVEEIISDEFNNFLLETAVETLGNEEIDIPSEDADIEIKKAYIFNLFCRRQCSCMNGQRFKETEYYTGDFHTLNQKCQLPDIPTKSYGPVIEKFVNNIVKLEKAGLLKNIQQSNHYYSIGDIITYLDLWSRRFGTDRELKILDFIIDNNLSKYFDGKKFEYIDKLLSILCTNHPKALEIKEKVENDPYLKNRFGKYTLILSNPNIEKSEIKFTQKNLSKIVNTILDNKDVDGLISLLDSVEKTYVGNNERIHRNQKTILSKLLKSDRLDNFNKVLEPDLPYKEILKELVYEELNACKTRLYSYWKRQEIEEHMAAVFKNSDFVEKLKVYEVYSKSFISANEFCSIFFNEDDKLLALKHLLSEWNEKRKDGSLTKAIEKLFDSTYNKIITGSTTSYYWTYSLRLIGEKYTCTLFDSNINKFVLYYFLMKDNEDFLDLYLYYKENKRIPSLLFYLEKENEVSAYMNNKSSIGTNNNLGRNNTKNEFPVFSSIYIVIFLCMLKKLISENKCFDSLYDPLHAYLFFNPRYNLCFLTTRNDSSLTPSLTVISKYNMYKTYATNARDRAAYTAYQMLIATSIILSRNYSTSYELQHKIIKEENEKIVSSSHPAIIDEDGLPVYCIYPTKINTESDYTAYADSLIESLEKFKSMYGENYKIETLKILLDEVFNYLFNGEYTDYLLKNADQFALHCKNSTDKDLVGYLKDFIHSLNIDYLVDTYSKFFDIDKNVYNEKNLMKMIDDSSTVFSLVENTTTD